MKPIARLVFCVLFAAIGGGHQIPAEANASGCIAPSFTYDIKATLDSCAALLSNENLSDADRARILTLHGRSLKADNQLDAAIRDFDAALALRPDDAGALAMRAWAAIDKRDFETADKIVGKLHDANPDDATAYSISGTMAFSKGDHAAAMRLYNKAIKLRPDDVLARDNRMIVYKLNRLNRAVIAEADAMLALANPDLDTAYTTLENKRMTFRTLARLERALAWERMGLTEATEKAFAEWIAVEPSAVSYGYRAAFYARREHNEQALSDLDKAFADDPNYWPLSYTQGSVYLYTGRNEDAIRSLSRAIELNPNYGAAYWRRAMAERRLHRDEAALRDALQAVAVDKDVRANKIATLTKLGYLQLGPSDTTDPLPALADAVQACMLDERCW